MNFTCTNSNWVFTDTIANEFRDGPDLTLSNAQNASLAGWWRPREAFRVQLKPGDDRSKPVQPTMFAANNIDLIQDVATDCSVVASLCAAIALADGAFPKVCNTLETKLYKLTKLFTI